MKRTSIFPRGNCTLSRCFSLLLILAFSLALATTAAAQKKKKKDATPPPAPTSNTAAMPDEQRIDYLISEMMGAWQVGDIDKLHKCIADDISVVNGFWAPPIIGWANYLTNYNSQRARTQQVRMDRTNTLIRLSGKFAWASYQWDFSAVVDGQPDTAQGQTTLVFEKRGDDWVVVHNHTSLVQASQPVTPASTITPTPAKP
ncbi:MAG TPA: nuclear transport factor 2 family protein [Candidatus Acidoferrum sp.]|nr:nuclear transport factor 2 family protein [Candidatus Acidoferrum sp.]